MGIVSGLMISLLLSSTIVFAAPVKKMIEVYFNNTKLVVDGNTVISKDSYGNVLQPMSYNGTNYLPVRAVAEALGKSVTWDPKLNTIYIGKHDENTPSIRLEDMNYLSYKAGYTYDDNVGFKAWNDEYDKANDESTSQHGIKYWMFFGGYDNYGAKQPNSITTEYLLNQKYKQFKGKYVLHYDSRNATQDTVLKVFGDDTLLYTSPVMKAGVLPVDFNIDVTGIIKLKIKLDMAAPSGMDDYRTIYSYGIMDSGLYE